MKLNCKQGDLAVIVLSVAGNEGKIVRCKRLIPDQPWAIMRGPRWVLESTLRDSDGCRIDSVADSCMRPLRDSDGEDEVLRLVGRPVGEPQAA